jgi:hypothetical protein
MQPPTEHGHGNSTLHPLGDGPALGTLHSTMRRSATRRHLIVFLVGALVAVAVLLLLSASAALAADMTKVQGESMTLATGISVVNDSGAEPTGAGKAIRYTASATARQNVTYTKGATQIVVRARKEGTNANHPLLRVFTKTGTQSPVLRGTATVSSTSYQEYTFTFSANSGTHQVQVRGDNIASGRLLRVDYFRIPEAAPTVDTTPPETTITSGPSGSVTGTAATFGFTSSEEPGSTFGCQLLGLESSAPASCTSPESYSGLTAGTEYTFSVWATDASGNADATPDTSTFTPLGTVDSCTGTTVNPTSDLENIVDNPGTYCLRGGIYEEADEQVVINADDVTIRNVPGERAELRGRIRTNDGATNVRFIGTDVSPEVEGIVLNATYSPISWSTGGGMGHFSSDPHLIRGNGTVFDNVELDGDNDVLGDPWYPSQPSTPARAIGTCVLIADGTDGALAADVQIINSDIHNCGAPPNDQAGNVGYHALYLSGGLRVRVEHNQIYENGTRGLQIRSGTDNTHVYGNVIDENYVGIGFDDPNTNDNIAENNVVTRNANKNIRNLSDAGTGNVARNNCGYGEPIPDGTIGNVSYSNNVNVSSNPYSVDPDGPEPNADAVVSDTTCNAKLPAGSRFLP